MAAPGVATQLQKGEAFDIDESDGLICVSVGSSFSAASPAVTALALNGEEPLYVKVAPKMGGGDTGREKWNQNSYRDEMLFPVDLAAVDDDVHSFVFYVVPTSSKAAERGKTSFSLCGASGKAVRTAFAFDNCNAKKNHVGLVLQRVEAGSSKWRVRAVGESLSEIGFEESAKLMHELTHAPKRLSVQIVEARGLRAFDRNGKSDPYVIVKSNRQVYKTKVQKKTLAPQWNETTHIAHFYDKHWQNKDILFEMFDYDALSKDDLMGIVLLDNKEIFAACESDEQFDKWLPLVADERVKASKVQGELHIIAKPI